MHLVFWQPIPSFHQEGFLCALAQADWVDSVTLKYESELPADRRQSGWRDGNFQGVKLEQIRVSEVPEDTDAHIHIFTGFQTHPMIWAAFHRLPRVAQCRRFAFAEAPESIGLKGILRRVKYQVASRRIAPRLDGMLALGQLGVDFYRSVLPNSVPVHEFAYYDVSDAVICTLNCSDAFSHQAAARNDQPATNNQQPATPFRFLYVGQLIRRKGLYRLFKALAKITHLQWVLTVVGQGPSAVKLRRIAERQGFAHKIEWMGMRPQAELNIYYSKADAVILPSVWDGWGMTVNEALRFGVQAFASSTCGAASALPSEMQLPKHVRNWAPFFESKILQGRLTLEDRAAYQKLATALTGEAGAECLRHILLTSHAESL